MESGSAGTSTLASQVSCFPHKLAFSENMAMPRLAWESGNSEAGAYLAKITSSYTLGHPSTKYQECWGPSNSQQALNYRSCSPKAGQAKISRAAPSLAGVCGQLSAPSSSAVSGHSARFCGQSEHSTAGHAMMGW